MVIQLDRHVTIKTKGQMSQKVFTYVQRETKREYLQLFFHVTTMTWLNRNKQKKKGHNEYSKTMQYKLLITIITLLLMTSVYFSVYTSQTVGTFKPAIPKMKVSNSSKVLRTLYQPVVHTDEDYELKQSDSEWNMSAAFEGSRGKTSAIKSNLVFLSDLNSIHRGDIITLQIHARDDNGRERVFGGDIWRVDIYNTKIKFASTCMNKIIDHDNGSYTAHVYAGKSGNMQLRVSLVAQREAVEFVKSVVWPSEPRITWRGIFAKGDFNESSYCFLMRNGVWKNKCEFPHAKALGKTTFLCEPPTVLDCKDLIQVTNGPGPIEQEYVELRNLKTQERKNKYLFKSVNSIMANVPGQIVIHGRKASDYELYSVPQCNADIQEPVSDGYWLGSIWHSLVCQDRQWNDVTEIQQCLRGKDVYFHGDSTMRQWYHKMLQMAGVKVDANNWRDKPESIPGQFVVSGDDPYAMMVTNVRDDINFTFNCHAISRHRTHIPIHRFKFMADILDSMRTPKCNYVFVFSLWSHFHWWALDSYTERLVNIRKAVERLRKRCPNSIMAVKGAHYRGGSPYLDVMYYNMNRIMKEIFKDQGIFFINIWDMNLSYSIAKKTPYSIHMPIDLIQQEVNMFLSHVCLHRT
ncbi:NXPE family member 3-like [Saccoglossus kowalevskii]